MVVTTKQTTMRKAWREFVETGRAEQSDLVPGFILASWERCKKLKVDPFQKFAPIILPPDLLQERKNANSQLIEVANQTMQDIYDFIKGSEYTFALFDKDGYLLSILGDQEVIDNTKKGNWREGACWNELGAGTNAVSLAIIEDRPLQVQGFEHYCRCSHYWSGSAAPIHDVNGNLLGILDLTGRSDLVNPHTLGIIVSAVKSIERMLTIKSVLAKFQIADKQKEIIMNMMDESLIVMNSDGIITHINSSAANLLSIDNRCIGMSLNTVVPGDNDSLCRVLHAADDITDDEIAIKLNNGTRIKCIISKRNIISNGQKSGIVITFYKSTRIKNLAKKFCGATKTFDNLVGNDSSFHQTVRLAQAAAKGNANILILGESGTGKDMFAQAIHHASPFADGPFVAINCAAIPHELIASELFGYADGVFTGAVKGGKPGKLELAEGGTLFLDEIGDMPLTLQTTLLRVIENKTFMRVGGDREIPVNERIIAATNKDLLYEISVGNFRADLYYRLNIVSLYLPPLRGRYDEIRTFLEYFIKKMARETGKPPLKVTKSTLQKLMEYDWPGNIRELHNLVARSYYLDSPDLTLTGLVTQTKNASHHRLSFNADNVEAFESKLIKELLEQNNYKVAEVAYKMGQSRSTLYRKIKKYQIPTSDK
jgi:transcriptional regulator of acetoin/glycerol metabolism